MNPMTSNRHILSHHLRYLRRLCVGLSVIALTTLTACSTLKPVERTEKPYFNMEGRMAVDMPRSPEKGSSGKIRWDEYPSATDITLSTPFGNAIALVHLTPTQATYKGSDGSVVTEDSADELFYRLFGMDMPIANLRDWIGTPNRPLVKVRDENGWHVVVTDTFSNPNLAKRIEVSRNQPEPMTLTLGIDNRSDLKNTDSAPIEEEIDLDKLLPPGAQEKTIAPAQPAVKKPIKKP